jgi:glutamate formiminotransferase/formiminotetrahydrofolate cyclodeaminase
VAAETAFRAIAKAAEVIDMREHPRLGATDVCPFVPVEGITLAECAANTRALSRNAATVFGRPTAGQ